MICGDIVVGLDEVIDIRQQAPRRFGTAGAFPNLFGEVWKEELHVFSAEGGGGDGWSAATSLGHPERTSPNVLNRFPVEVLMVEDIPTIVGDMVVLLAAIDIKDRWLNRTTWKLTRVQYTCTRSEANNEPSTFCSTKILGATSSLHPCLELAPTIKV